MNLIRRSFTLAQRQLNAVRTAAKAFGLSHGASEIVRRALDEWIEKNRKWLTEHGWKDR